MRFFCGIVWAISANFSKAFPITKICRAGLSAISFAPLRSAKGCRFYPYCSFARKSVSQEIKVYQSLVIPEESGLLRFCGMTNFTL